MGQNRRVVTVGLDVHKATVRLAVVAGGEVVGERTVAHDHDVVLG